MTKYIVPKGWIVRNNQSKAILWQSANKHSVIAAVQDVFSKSSPKTWIVTINTTGRVVGQRRIHNIVNIKTKMQAFRVAKAWMKRHPRG